MSYDLELYRVLNNIESCLTALSGDGTVSMYDKRMISRSMSDLEKAMRETNGHHCDNCEHSCSGYDRHTGEEDWCCMADTQENPMTDEMAELSNIGLCPRWQAMLPEEQGDLNGFIIPDTTEE